MAPGHGDEARQQERCTDSDIEIAPVYRSSDLEGWEPDLQLGDPGGFPYTRGIYPEMYRGRLWTMRQYAGFGTAEATNERFRFLLSAGQTGLSCAFDLPTQMGLDSDHRRAEGEVGKVGVAIDSLADMRLLLAGIPLGEVTTSMTINATAAILLLLYELVAEEQGVAPEAVKGTVQNDILKEYVARGTYIYPPRPSMRLVTDTFSYCAERLKSWNTISISGYHIREAGSTAVQEIAFTMANGIAYVEAALAAGLDVDAFAPRLSFFWNAHNHLFEEVSKYRVARRMWARIMTERFGATDERSKLLRFHTQTGGSTLTAQQPENNIVRVTLQALAAVLGGTQSLHTNGFDEALGLPTTRAAAAVCQVERVRDAHVVRTPVRDVVANDRRALRPGAQPRRRVHVDIPFGFRRGHLRGHQTLLLGIGVRRAAVLLDVREVRRQTRGRRRVELLDVTNDVDLGPRRGDRLDRGLHALLPLTGGVAGVDRAVGEDHEGRLQGVDGRHDGAGHGVAVREFRAERSMVTTGELFLPSRTSFSLSAIAIALIAGNPIRACEFPNSTMVCAPVVSP